ncbi:MAG TPA: ATP-binding protein, partial [Terriglobales bacterium]
MAIVNSIPHLSIPVSELSQVGEARRAARIIAEDSGFDDDQAGKTAIVVTEAATNLAKHAKHGEILLCPHRDPVENNWIDVLAIDKGPGIKSISQSVADGFSTAGTAGTGLGAIARLADYFEIFTDQASGTALLARIKSRPGPVRKPVVHQNTLQSAFIAIPKKGETLCGDVVNLRMFSGGGSFLVADGLGHGISAHEAAREAAKIFSEEAGGAAAEVLDAVHRGLRSTRGAAVA